MKLRADRLQYESDRTLGELFVDDLHEAWTLEDMVRGEGAAKVWGKTAIPYGTYRLRAHYSPHFKRMVLMFCDVPGFDLVYFHGGNDPDDTDGCVLVGSERHLHTISNCAEVVASLERRVFAALHEGEVWCEVRDGRVA